MCRCVQLHLIFFLPSFSGSHLRCQACSASTFTPRAIFLRIYCAVHFSTEWETFFLLRDFVALSTTVLPNQYKGIWDSCAKMLIHLVVGGGGKPDKLSWTNPKDSQLHSEQLPVYQTVLKMHHLLHECFALEKVGRTLQKIFAMPGVICPNIRNPTFMLLKSSVYFYSLFFPVSFQFIATSCYPECSFLFAVCF